MKDYEEQEEIKEETGIKKILNNKKIVLPVSILIIVLLLFVLFSPSKEKKVEKVDAATKIDSEQLEKDNKDDNSQTQINPVQNQTFGDIAGNTNNTTPPETGNLQDPPGYYNPNSVSSTSSNYQYGDYTSDRPNSYNQDNFGTEDIGSTSDNNSRKDRKRTGLKVDRIQMSKDKNTTGQVQEQQLEQQPQQQGQPTSTAKQQTKTQDRFRLNQSLQKPRTDFILQTGTKIPATIVDSVDSDLQGNVRAVVRQDVYDSIRNKYLLIPKGSKIFGTYDSNIIYGQNRLVLIWQRIILPNGISIDLEGMQGADITGQVGIKGKVNNHTWKLLRSVVMSSFVNLFSSGISVSASKKLGKNTSAKATIGQNVADETSNNIKSAGDAILERDLNQQPTIKIKAGQRFDIIVDADMELYPYNQLVSKRLRGVR
jgi:conjugation trbI family protein